MLLTAPLLLVFGLSAIAAGFGQYIVALFAPGSAGAARALGVVGLVLFALATFSLARALF